jgi:transposase
MAMFQLPIDAEAGTATTVRLWPPFAAVPASAPPELSVRPRRRTFTAQDKLRILAETDRAAETGGIAAILRREGLYSSALTEWRRLRDAGALGALVPGKRGPKTIEANPMAAELALVQCDNARLTRRLERAEAIIHLQKSRGVAGPPAGTERRRALTAAVVALAPDRGMTAAVCAALGASRASVQRGVSG